MNGPPLEFRAVKKSTGESKAVKYFNDLGYLIKVHFLDGSYEFAGSQEKWALYQSTGHHDADGKEVFFGDVLCFISGEDKRLYKVIYLSDTVYLSLMDESDILSIDYSNDQMIVIGNIHTPTKQLQAAAKVRAERG